MSIRVEIANLRALFAPLNRIDRNAILVQLAEAARSFWISQAHKHLRSSRADYVNGIQPIELADGSATIALVGKLPNMVEQGISAFGMHDGLLKAHAEGVHLAADGGRFRAVPFRHQTPGSAGVLGAPMGSAFEPRGPKSRRLIPPTGVNAADIGSRVYQDAKRLKGKQALRAGLAPKLSEKHATDIYAGMRKVIQTSANGTKQSTYMTWRTISVGPDGQPRPTGKWEHPGIEAHHLAPEVIAYVEAIAPDVIKAYFENQP